MAIFASIIFFFNGQWPLAKFWKLKKIFSLLSGQKWTKIFKLNFFSFSSITYPLLLSLHNSFFVFSSFLLQQTISKRKNEKLVKIVFVFFRKIHFWWWLWLSRISTMINTLGNYWNIDGCCCCWRRRKKRPENKTLKLKKITFSQREKISNKNKGEIRIWNKFGFKKKKNQMIMANYVYISVISGNDLMVVGAVVMMIWMLLKFFFFFGIQNRNLLIVDNNVDACCWRLLSMMLSIS